MLILVPSITHRLKYIFDFVFKEVLHTDYILTDRDDVFNDSDINVKWSYGRKISGYPYLPSANILFEAHIEHQLIHVRKIEDIVSLFDIEEAQSEFNFDLFASAFYLISRYEEYLPSVLDEHRRYAAFQSIAVQHGFLETAMVNRYILWIAKWLKKNFSDIHIRLESPKCLVSIDVDHPFYSKDVSFDKLLLRSLKELSFFQKKDKYDTFDFILSELEHLPSIFFFLCPKSPSQLDHLNQRDSKNFRNLIQFIRTQSKIGIHPSYDSQEKSLLHEEILWLSQEHERPIKSSRFHYLKFDIESSPSMLETAGIQNDFSLGYGSHCGFRTSTSHPFYWFDLKKNRKTGLRIFTPCIMDSTFQYGYQNDFDKHCERVIDEVKTYGGVFVPIFHNDVLSDSIWQTSFSELINTLKSW